MENTGYLIMNSSKHLTYDLNSELRKQDLTAPQWAVLQQINRYQQERPTTAKQLVTLLDMDKPTLSVILKRLEQKNFIIKKRSSHDSRSYELFLTDSGKQTYLSGEKISEHVLEKFVAPLSIEEKRQLNELLQKLNGV
ncbi:MarR family transcriptional regulator [Enterococcus devriesei]|uniref:MarR family winged helix-turn-helix transcriptional regulator n=1 Tax=Enterococcus devriesei TaxID=319970 RepID=UPI001C11B734|nr:MarR family transcriptional regulator [Enterococcus devriesei]MBU5364969.1 MarR family transcriptional regulator [Enterococcus devriesei]MDT2821394.1 MarR family transcriptional regulator [Enterococcus devriesei]